MPKTLEVLSPAGSYDALKAAVLNGADSVYFGTTMFNARQGAQNFDRDSLFDAVKYCRQRGVSTYITLNTLIGDDELPEFERQVELVAKSGADAAIFQDLGAAEIAGEICPSLRRHASTQMTIHSKDGAEFVGNLGFERVILSRELSLKDIKTITKSAGIETEIFAHGALCMCYSGRCYMSALAGGRSANRGRCAQPCRMRYELNGGGENQNPLSLKDLSLTHHLEEIKDAGVSCIKIEGRLKRPEYVALATRVLKNAVLSGQQPSDSEMSALMSIFSRSGFTDSYFTGNKGPHMFGVRTKNEDFSRYAKILREQAATFEGDREAPLVSVRGKFTALRGRPVEFEVSDGRRTASCTGAIPEEAKNTQATRESVKENLSKSGGTPFYFEDIEIDLDDGLWLKASELNSIRRQALSGLLEERGKAPGREVFSLSGFDKKPNKRAPSGEEVKLYAKFENLEQVPANAHEVCDMIFLPPHELIKADFPKNGKYAAALPYIIKDSEREEILALAGELKSRGAKAILCENPAQIEMMRGLGFELFGGPGLNVFNSRTAEIYAKAGLSSLTYSFELNCRSISKMRAPCESAIAAYGRLPAMVCENCIIKNRHGKCAKGQKNILKDRLSNEFPILCAFGCRNVILNCRTLYLADRKEEIIKWGADALWLYFTTESALQALRVMLEYKTGESGEMKPSEHTRGLYYRSV